MIPTINNSNNEEPKNIINQVHIIQAYFSFCTKHTATATDSISGDDDWMQNCFFNFLVSFCIVKLIKKQKMIMLILIGSNKYIDYICRWLLIS